MEEIGAPPRFMASPCFSLFYRSPSISDFPFLHAFSFIDNWRNREMRKGVFDGEIREVSGRGD